MSEVVVDHDATTRCVKAGLAVSEVRHHRRDDETRLVVWSACPDDDQLELAATLLRGYQVHHDVVAS